MILELVKEGIITVLGWVIDIFKSLIEIGIGLPSEWKILFTVLTILGALISVNSLIKSLRK